MGLLDFATEMPKAGSLVHAIEEFRLLLAFHDAGCGKSLLIGVLFCRCGLIHS